MEARVNDKAKECNTRLSQAPIATPEDQMKKAMLERQCGNIVANWRANRTLIDNIRQTCNKHGSTSEECKGARDAFLINNRPPGTPRT